MCFHLHAKVCLTSLLVHLQISSKNFVRKKKKQSEVDEHKLEAYLVDPQFLQTTFPALVLPWLKVIGVIEQLSLLSRDFIVDASAGTPPTCAPLELRS